MCKDIAKSYADFGVSERSLMKYIYLISEINGIKGKLLDSSRKFTNSNLSRKNNRERELIDDIFENNKLTIYQNIDKGVDSKTISKIVGINNNSLFTRLPQKYKELLKQNNIKQKSIKLKQYHQQYRNGQYTKYQSLILQFIKKHNYNVCISDIMGEFGQLNCIVPILKNNNLYDTIRNVGHQKIKQTCKNNSKIGASYVKLKYDTKKQSEIQLYKDRFIYLAKQQWSIAFIERDAIQNGISKCVVKQLADTHKDIVCKWEQSKHYKNPSFGKQPSPSSGIGSSGWIVYQDKKIFFRSTLQCQIYCYLIYNNIKFQISKHKIQYTFGQKLRNYFPDINIENQIIQIKPKKLLQTKQNLAKFNSAKSYCKKFSLTFKVVTQDTYPIFTDQINNFVMNLYDNKLILFTNENSDKKFIKSRKYYERNNSSN